jgi:3-ketosteroid 9alpha-monooxygenase subunit A
MEAEISGPRREHGRFPFGIPNSWYVVAYSDEISAGALKHLKYFGEELILFRGEDGKVGLLDAYCDHLGAHLAFGGKVVGNSVQCPFHNWQWGGDGRCVAIPYASIIPPSARIRHYPVEEHSGFVWAWYHRDGKAPNFQIPQFPQYGDPEWTSDWIRYEWTIRTHPQEIFENGLDSAHFSVVHKFEMPTGAIARFEGHEHIWGSRTSRQSAGGETGRESISHSGRVMGLGCGAVRFIGDLDTLIVVGTTPLSGDETHIRMVVLGREKQMHGAGSVDGLQAYADVQAELLTQDFEIWEHKKYRAEPKLCHRDGPIDRYRQWASQFYA